MKNFNNRGWSIGTMITFICIFFFFILIIGIVAYNFGIEKSSPYPIYNIEEQENDR